MGTTKEDLATQAFTLIGGEPVTDFTSGDSLESDAANQLYESMVQAELGSFEWNFAKFQVQLSKDSTDPLGSEWSSRFRIDTQAITVRNVLVEGYSIRYEIQGSFIQCDATADDTVIMEYIGRPDESKWPAYFELVMIYKLASDFAGALARDGQLVGAWEKKYVFQLRRARAMDAQSETAKRFTTRRLVDVRR